MNRENIIVDMESPTPIDSYRFKSVGEINISYSKGLSSKYSITIAEVDKKEVEIKNFTDCLLQIWSIIEVIREKAYKDSKIVNVRDEDARTTCKRITLATTLSKKEKAIALKKQVNRIKSWRRKSVVENKYHSRERKKLNPIIIRPILREEKTW
tara:strand:+ start:822 stop:1283 length:462 start_codon:yes stop_codon:yes gene_type:complete